MKKLLFVLLFLTTTLISFANHTKGGWMYYEYLGQGTASNTLKYRITLKLYTNCTLNPNQFDPSINFSIFANNDASFFGNVSVPYSDSVNINNCSSQVCYPCIQNIPSICYKITTYTFVKDLPVSSSGYTISFQRCCRISSIVNLEPPSNSVGETWTVNIPGTKVAGAQFNNSARFAQNDTAIICAHSSFVFDFSATDPDGDSLTYAFSPAYSGGGMGAPTPTTASAPPYLSVDYSAGFSGFSPMGNTVSINSITGMVSGIAPSSGVYVVTVTVSEYNKVTRIKKAEVRKSLHIQVADCSKTEAVLDPSYSSCDDVTGFTVSFVNKGSSANIQTYHWDFGDGNTSTAAAPTHTYAAAGDYKLILDVNKGLDCPGTDTSIVHVYPGFFPKFDIAGQCTNVPVQFTDLTTTNYPSVNKWIWDFGDTGSQSNIATTQNPQHTYTIPGAFTITLIVSSDKGCVDTISKMIDVFKSPPLELSNDTLICSIDTLQLHAIGNGTLLWSPNYMISDITSATPLVSPDVTTTYHVQITDAFGCVGNDSVKVRVVDFVTLLGPNDTTICQTDPIVLHVNSDALYYTWTPDDGSISNTKVQNATVRPLINTTYHVRGNISNKCFADDYISVKVVPYPAANAGPDIQLCLGYSTQLQASGGAYYNWSPALFLSATNIPNPRVNNPTSGVTYMVSVRDTLGCPKAVRDTIRVNVIRIHANAGPSDTSVVLGQPLQLNATGGTNYLWTPNTWLSADNIPNPIALPRSDIQYAVTVSDANGCIGTDNIFVHLYNLDAGLYVPNAFTPNGDGKNDVFEPIELGLKTLDIFNIYNRWGQLIYSTTDMKKGWDGTFKGRAQDPDTYVWYGEGTDYTGKKVKKKGTVILIRE